VFLGLILLIIDVLPIIELMMAILLLDALSQIFEPLLDIIVNNFLQSTSLHLRRHSCFTGLDRGALLLLLLRYGRRYSHLVRLRS